MLDCDAISMYNCITPKQKELFKLTKRERIIAAINHQSTDIVPHNIQFTYQAHDNVAAYLGDEHFIEKIGNHILEHTHSVIGEIPDRPGYFIDEFGVVWNRTGADKDIGVIDNILIPEADMGAYTFPVVDTERIDTLYRDFANTESDCFKLGMIGFSMFERAWTLRGMENFLMDMLAEPDFAHALLDKICDYNMQILDIALKYDIDGFYFGDDWGQQQGMIMGPKLWREFIKPRMARMYARVKQAGKFVFQHSCGDIREILGDVAEIGLDVYQTFQSEIYDFETVKAEYGDKLTFWGGIGTQSVLAHGTADEVEAAAKHAMAVMGKNGGYIAAPTHAVPQDVPPQNIMRLIEVFLGQN